MKIVNFAHGEFYMLGGFFFYYLSVMFNIPFPISALLAVIAIFLIGSVVEFLTLRPMFVEKMDRPGEYATIVTFGLSVFFINLALAVFGYHYKKPPDFIVGSISLGYMAFPAGRVIAAIASSIVLVFVLLLVKRTWYGKAMQATAQNRNAAAILGVDTLKINNLAFGLSVVLAAIAGILLAPVFVLSPDIGESVALKAYVITVLGGMGSLKGSIIGAILLGVAENFVSFYVSPAYRDVVAFVILIVVLLLRPQGLFGEKERRL
jgi:branched-chain amino acid transport system permease protein